MLHNSHNFLEILNKVKTAIPVFLEDYHESMIRPQLNKKYQVNAEVLDDGTIKYNVDISESKARTKQKQDCRIQEILAIQKQNRRTHKFTISETQIADMMTSISDNYSFKFAIDTICKTLQMLSCQIDIEHKVT